MVTQQHPKPEDKAWSQKSWPPTKQQIRACGLYDGKETNQKPRNRPIKVRKMARLGAILRVKTGDAREHAHALELSDLNVRIDSSGKSISLFLHAIIALICMRLIPHRHGENRRSAVNISPHQLQKPTASGFQATRQRHFQKTLHVDDRS